MSPAPTAPALAAYRHVLRAARLAFQGDARMLSGARTQARQAFEAGRAVAPASPEHAAAVQHAEDVATVLRQNVVQGSSAGEPDTWRLNIHGETERGDNESVKVSGQKMREKKMGAGS